MILTIVSLKIQLLEIRENNMTDYGDWTPISVGHVTKAVSPKPDERRLMQTPVYITQLTIPMKPWRCEMHGLIFHVEEGKQPNAFYRVMLRLGFGIRWRYVGEDLK